MKRFRLFGLSIVIFQLLLNPVLSYGAIYPAPLCQLLMQYSGKETLDQEAIRLSVTQARDLINQFLNQTKDTLKRPDPLLEVPTWEGLYYDTGERDSGRIHLFSADSTAIEGLSLSDLLNSAIETLSEPSASQTASVWNTESLAEIAHFQKSFFKASHSLKKHYLARLKKNGNDRIGQALFIGLGGLILLTSVSTYDHDPASPYLIPLEDSKNLVIAIIGAIGFSMFGLGIVSFLLSSYSRGFEVENTKKLRSAIFDFSRALKSKDDWALLHLERSTLNFDAFTFVDERDQKRKLIVMMWGELPSNEVLEKMQSSFEID